MRRITLAFSGITIRADLLETPTATAIWDAVPIDAVFSTWGDEVYFDCGVTCGEEDDATDLVTAGEIAYWPPGDAIAIGFGRTPASRGHEIRLASPANISAKTGDDVRLLKGVLSGSRVRITRTD